MDDTISSPLLREEMSDDDIEETGLRLPFDIRDHFTLRSSIFRFRNRVVMDGVRHQMIFTVDDDEPPRTTPLNISVRRATRYGGAITLIKFALLYVLFFMSGVSSFSFQVTDV